MKLGRNSKVELFDLETIEMQSKEAEATSAIDKAKKFYFETVWKRDFGYITKGLKVDPETGLGPELLFVGNMTKDATRNRFVMANPSLVIGSDRMDLYEFFGRRREVMRGQAKTLVRLSIGITLCHAVIVQVPTLFSRYFGDSITQTEQKLGAEDQSEMGLKLSRMKSAAQRKDL